MLSSHNTSTCNSHHIPPFPQNHDLTSSSFFPASPPPPPPFPFHFHLSAMPPSTITKTTKKDRHSKINTARGPRDRRMRLSLEIARKFFDLQDMLGYDKASRTVEWLLTTSRAAIKDLANNNNPSSDQSSSTCEQEPPPPPPRREKGKREAGRRASVGKESRRKARERARERTSQKRRLVINSEDRILVESTSGAPEYEATSFGFNHADADHLQSPPWNTSAGFCYHAQNAAFFNQEDEEIGELEFSGKAWEDFNTTFNLSE